MDVIAAFAAAIGQSGIGSAPAIIADGHIHRFGAKSSAWYILYPPEGAASNFASGAFGCWKSGIKQKWCSKSELEITETDRKVLRQRKRDELAKQQALQAATADKAKRIWGICEQVTTHPYLERKGVTLRAARHYKGALVVPLKDGNEIVSLQFIAEDGAKKYLFGGKKEGCYMTMGGSDVMPVIVICEGYATGRSIHMATNFPTVVAFDAGNLRAVAVKIRESFPDAEIIIAGDNDQWTVINGSLTNVGVIAARGAASVINGRAVWPVFTPEQLANKPKDFNDLHALEGLEAVRRRIMAEEPYIEDITPPTPVKAAPQSVDWMWQLLPGKALPSDPDFGDFPRPFDAKSKYNAYLMLKHHPYFAGWLIYNEFSDHINLVKCPPWEKEQDFTPRSIVGSDFFMFASIMERAGIMATKETATDAVIQVAHDNRINPAREYFDRLIWDGVPRLNTWLTYYMGADEEPPEYLALAGSKWLIGGVTRVYEPGAKFDYVLILEGGQGLGKSMALRALGTIQGETYFADEVGEVRNKDSLIALQGKLIVEMAELASFKRAESEEMKAFITRQVDEYRPPYGRTMIKRPRRFIIAGSTNPQADGQYLTDSTGNRRYWPVRCKAIDTEAFTQDVEQLWAEAVMRYKRGERSWVSHEEAAWFTAEQHKRYTEDAWLEKMEEMLDDVSELTFAAICDKMQLKYRELNNGTRKRIVEVLTELGWKAVRPIVGGKRVTVWKRGGTLDV